MTANHELSPSDVNAMPLSEFERRFGFRPIDALEKHYFASNAKRPTATIRAAIESGLLGHIDYGKVVME